MLTSKTLLKRQTNDQPEAVSHQTSSNALNLFLNVTAELKMCIHLKIYFHQIEKRIALKYFSFAERLTTVLKATSATQALYFLKSACKEITALICLLFMGTPNSIASLANELKMVPNTVRFYWLLFK